MVFAIRVICLPIACLNWQLALGVIYDELIFSNITSAILLILQVIIEQVVLRGSIFSSDFMKISRLLTQYAMLLNRQLPICLYRDLIFIKMY